MASASPSQTYSPLQLSFQTTRGHVLEELKNLLKPIILKGTHLIPEREAHMTKKVSAEKLLEKAKKPAKLALAYHPFHEEKVQVMPKCAVCGSCDFAMHVYI